jgi:hypothetical protein
VANKINKYLRFLSYQNVALKDFAAQTEIQSITDIKSIV